MQGLKGSKRIEMIIKMISEFKLTVVHFARPIRPNPMDCAWIYRWTKNCGKSGLGLWATGLSRAVGRGPPFNKTPQNMVRVVFESADGSSYRGFELPGVKLQ